MFLKWNKRRFACKMNPHFIFNTLNSIQGLIASHDNKTARLYLSRFSRLMRQILENSREDLIPMEEELDASSTTLSWSNSPMKTASTGLLTVRKSC